MTKTRMLERLKYRQACPLLDGGYRIEARAKINLTLDMIGRRPDGYHRLESLFAFGNFGDMLEFYSHQEGLALDISGPEAGSLRALGGGGGNNLILRAARLLADYAGMVPKARIRLVKYLPVAAGVGGGSMDAAACLLALSALWGLSLPKTDLHALALALGADVPAGLYQGPLWVTGVGEQLQAVSLDRSYGVLLVNPRVATETGQVFKAYQRMGLAFGKSQNRRPFWSMMDLIEAQNSLSLPATARTPVIARLLEILRGFDGAIFARMSGSGASCFALFDTAFAAQSALNDLKKQCPHWWARAGLLER